VLFLKLYLFLTAVPLVIKNTQEESPFEENDEELSDGGNVQTEKDSPDNTVKEDPIGEKREESDEKDKDENPSPVEPQKTLLRRPNPVPPPPVRPPPTSKVVTKLFHHRLETDTYEGKYVNCQ